jgi:hypothetical protein
MRPPDQSSIGHHYKTHNLLSRNFAERFQLSKMHKFESYYHHLPLKMFPLDIMSSLSPLAMTGRPLGSMECSSRSPRSNYKIQPSKRCMMENQLKISLLNSSHSLRNQDHIALPDTEL